MADQSFAGHSLDSRAEEVTRRGFETRRSYKKIAKCYLLGQRVA